MKNLSLALALMGACAATSTFAATGTVTFNGKLVAGTCGATVNGGTASQTVTLPTVHVSSLGAVAATAGTTPFTITLTGQECKDGTTTATPYFESEVAKVNAAGRLINTTTATDLVEVQLLNNAGTVINVNDISTTQATSVSATGTFNYSARYYATAAATTAGAVTSSVSYSIIYK